MTNKLFFCHLHLYLSISGPLRSMFFVFAGLVLGLRSASTRQPCLVFPLFDPPASPSLHLHREKMASQYDQLSGFTQIVCDTGDIEAIKKFSPIDATTNPSLLYKAALMPEYDGLVNDAVTYAKKVGSEAGMSEAEILALTIDKMSVNFGCEILKVVGGYVSTEVDARLSFDAAETKKRAQRIIDMYKAAGYPKERVLIKIASTWEGIKACEDLQKEGISCNMTLLFSFAQAVACAESGATLISPFVGRIMDWYKARDGVTGYESAKDPGVISVTYIYNYYKKHGYDTIVMGASFRNIGEIQALAGCDKLTISPDLLSELKAVFDPLEVKLTKEKAAEACDKEKISMSEDQFRESLNSDAMATEKLAEGIRGFSADLVKLEDVLRKKIAGSQYDQLSFYTNIVADTGEINAIKKFMPLDATTNPSLLYKASQLEEYADLVSDAVAYAKAQEGSDEFKLALMIDKMSVNFGCEILKVVPGYVSTEVDARLSFNAEETKFRARRIIDMYQAAGYGKERVLIKIASTWEGIKACEDLQKEGISCNMTLLFSFEQAVACAEANATLISPFVGRIMDYYKKVDKVDSYDKFADPGVISVCNIYAYYKKYGYKTIVMGASFRNIGEIQALAGCDKLTIAPNLLDELKACNDPLPRVLSPEVSPAKCTVEKVHMTEGMFRLGMNQNAMATCKLAEGIRGFSADLVSLEKILKGKLAVN